MSRQVTHEDGSISILDRYAQLRSDTVVQCIESAVDPDGVNGIWVLCPDNVGPGWTANFERSEWTPPVPVVPPTPEWAWYIDKGPFSDRLGPAAVVIDLSNVPALIAIRANFARRFWIDLLDQRVIDIINFMAGAPHPDFGTIATPLFDSAKATAVLTTPVALKDNFALRKSYFS